VIAADPLETSLDAIKEGRLIGHCRKTGITDFVANSHRQAESAAAQYDQVTISPPTCTATLSRMQKPQTK
jgi:hypothetical protein